MVKNVDLAKIRALLLREARPARRDFDHFPAIWHENPETGLAIMRVWTYNSKGGVMLNPRNYTKWEHQVVGNADGYWQAETHLAYDGQCKYGNVIETAKTITIERSGYFVTHWEIRIPFENLVVPKRKLVLYGQPMPKK